MISSLLATIDQLLTNLKNNSTLNLNAQTLDLLATSLASMNTAIEPSASSITPKNTTWSLYWIDSTCQIVIQARYLSLPAFDLFLQQIPSLQKQNIARIPGIWQMAQRTGYQGWQSRSMSLHSTHNKCVTVLWPSTVSDLYNLENTSSRVLKVVHGLD